MSALTVIQLALTTFVEAGLGVIAYFFICKIIPLIRNKAEQTTSSLKSFITSSNPLIWIIMPWRYQKGPSIATIKPISKPLYVKTNIFWTFVQGFAWLTLILLIYYLITSVGWKLPFLDNIYYNLIYARANGQPNGAHIDSYLFVAILAIYVSIKFKDIFLGGLTGALFVGIHEGVWIIAYYSSYYQYLTFNALTNVLKDVSFSTMIILFIVAFFKYPYQKIQWKDLSQSVYYYIAFIIAWMIFPTYFGYHLLPITTINNFNPAISHTVFNETIYFNDPIINAIEVLSWLFLFVGLIIPIARTKVRQEQSVLVH